MSYAVQLNGVFVIMFIIPKETIFYHMYAYKQHLNSTILSPADNGCHEYLVLIYIIEMANVLHLMGNASELDKLIQSFGKSIMIIFFYP